MNGRLYKLFIVLIALPLNTGVFADSYGTSYIAKWKGDAQAAFSLTVDDVGPWRGDMRNIQASLMEEYGIRGTFYPYTSPLTRDPAIRQVFLDIFNRGHELGDHSVTHPHLKGASLETIWSELSESKLFLEELTSVPCVSYAATFGELDPNIIAVAQELFISARGVEVGVNRIPGADIWNLMTSPRPGPWGTTWTNEEFITNLRQHIEDILAVEGWAVEIWHNLTSDPNELNSGKAVNEIVFRQHLIDLTRDYRHLVWIAPQGEVARYHLEWQETTIEILAVTEDAILLNLLFDGDKAIFDEPLTVVTVVPEHWLGGELVVMQNGRRLDYTIDVDGDEPCLLYDAIPGGGIVSILTSATDSLNLAAFAECWLTTSTSSNWNPKWDLAPLPTLDGKTNFIDFAALAARWRKVARNNIVKYRKLISDSLLM